MLLSRQKNLCFRLPVGGNHQMDLTFRPTFLLLSFSSYVLTTNSPTLMLSAVSSLQFQCPASSPSVHRPENWPGCGNDRFWHFHVLPLSLLYPSCCFSVGCDLSLGAVPPPLSEPLVQLADSDTVVLMTHCFRWGQPGVYSIHMFSISFFFLYTRAVNLDTKCRLFVELYYSESP